MNNIGYDIYESLIGNLYIVVSNKGVERVILDKKDFEEYIDKNNVKKDKELCSEVVKQLDEYFNKNRMEFDLKINLQTTEFRTSVYAELIKIPYGETRSYSDIAVAINNKKAVRAIGQANRRNEIVIIIPCHRVIGKSGNMIGYAGDKISIKEKLLKLESSN